MRTTTLRAACIVAGTLALVGVAGAAVAEETNPSNEDVDVTVEIAQIDEPGVLAMTVADTSAALTENGSDATVRQFTGTLPTVTITDTRTAEEIPDGVAWWVEGTSSAFTDDATSNTIGAEYLGWAPKLIDGGESGQVSEGDPVDSAVDAEAAPNNVGLVGQELLAMAFDSEAIVTDGSWTANADLFLRTPVDVEPGSYKATVTLSLFEDLAL